MDGWTGERETVGFIFCQGCWEEGGLQRAVLAELALRIWKEAGAVIGAGQGEGEKSGLWDVCGGRADSLR